MEKLIEQIKLKADSCSNSTKETRARKGAYVDCLMMAKEAYLQQLKQSENNNVISRSFHYDEKLLIELWYKRNPSHYLNYNGKDMFWKTAFMVFEDYVREILSND